MGREALDYVFEDAQAAVDLLEGVDAVLVPAPLAEDFEAGRRVAAQLVRALRHRLDDVVEAAEDAQLLLEPLAGLLRREAEQRLHGQLGRRDAVQLQVRRVALAHHLLAQLAHLQPVLFQFLACSPVNVAFSFVFLVPKSSRDKKK